MKITSIALHVIGDRRIHDNLFRIFEWNQISRNWFGYLENGLGDCHSIINKDHVKMMRMLEIFVHFLTILTFG